MTVDGARWAVVSEVTSGGNLRLKWLEDGSEYDVKHDALKLGLVRPRDCLVALADRSQIPAKGVIVNVANVIAEKPGDFGTWSVQRQKRWYKVAQETYDSRAGQPGHAAHAGEPRFDVEKIAELTEKKTEFDHERHAKYDKMMENGDSSVDFVPEANVNSTSNSRSTRPKKCCFLCGRRSSQVSDFYQTTEQSSQAATAQAEIAC